MSYGNGSGWSGQTNGGGITPLDTSWYVRVKWNNANNWMVSYSTPLQPSGTPGYTVAKELAAAWNEAASGSSTEMGDTYALACKDSYEDGMLMFYHRSVRWSVDLISVSSDGSTWHDLPQLNRTGKPAKGKPISVAGLSIWNVLPTVLHV